MSLSPVWFGPHKVGVSPLALNPDLLLSDDEVRGKALRGESVYIEDFLDSSGQGLHFSLKVPDSGMLFPLTAGNTISYSGLIYFPIQEEISHSLSFHPQGFRLTNLLRTDSEFEHFKVAGRFPLILFSHGYESEFLVHSTLLKILASHGFIVAALFHGDRRFGDDPMGTRDESSPVRRERLLLRGLSLRAALDWLARSPYHDAIDWQHSGGVGISFGGASMMLLSGAPLDIPGYDPDILRDARIHAAAAQVPYMGSAGFRLWSEDRGLWSDVDIPWLGISGTADSLAPLESTRRTLSHIPRDSYLVSMEGEEHFMSARGLRAADTWITTFVKAFLAGDSTARSAFRPGETAECGIINTLEIV